MGERQDTARGFVRDLARDFAVSSWIAGFVAVLVGFTSSAVIVFEAARAAGASTAQIGSWLWALGIGMAATSIGLSLRYRAPVLTAWSTPGAALLIGGSSGFTLGEITGAFVASGVLITLAGATGLFERWMNRVPLALAAAMLAGVLLKFGIDAFVAMKTQLALALAMCLSFLVVRPWQPRYAVLAALVVGCAVAAARGLFGSMDVAWTLTAPQWVTPQWSTAAMIGLALPLFIVTMASQNIPGVATLRANGYAPPLSPIIATTGVATTLLAPFGGFALNLAAITAAICMGREAHADPARRYTAAVAAGLFYLLLGLFGATVAALFAVFPRELVMAIAGLALLGTIGNALATALAGEAERDAALVTFLVTASGLTIASIGSAFWGLAAGLLVLGLRHLQQRRRQ
jgi:benzoate membrane transport protein